MLTEIDSLPSPKVKPTSRNWNSDAYSYHRTLGMSWHIVRTFQHMIVIRLVLSDQMTEYLLHIRTNFRIPVLVNRERAARVLDEEIEQTYLG